MTVKYKSNVFLILAILLFVCSGSSWRESNSKYGMDAAQDEIASVAFHK
jgi:hypothetical protein